MNKKQILSLGAVAALTALAPQSRAAEAEVKAHVDTPKTERLDRDADVRVRTDRDSIRTETDRPVHSKLRHGDKASGLLGMEVRNRENQKLGEIKDLVLDVDSGRVSYAVLAVGGFLGIGEKLIALPPKALNLSEAGDYLTLDADKAKIQAAPGFAATNWPNKNDPEINQFWSDIRGTGSPARSEINRRSSDVDLDLDKKHSIKSEVNVDTDRKHKIYTDADKDKKVKVEVNKD